MSGETGESSHKSHFSCFGVAPIPFRTKSAEHKRRGAGSGVPACIPRKKSCLSSSGAETKRGRPLCQGGDGAPVGGAPVARRCAREPNTSPLSFGSHVGAARNGLWCEVDHRQPNCASAKTRNEAQLHFVSLSFPRSIIGRRGRSRVKQPSRSHTEDPLSLFDSADAFIDDPLLHLMSRPSRAISCQDAITRNMDNINSIATYLRLCGRPHKRR